MLVDKGWNKAQDASEHSDDLDEKLFGESNHINNINQLFLATNTGELRRILNNILKNLN